MWAQVASELHLVELAGEIIECLEDGDLSVAIRFELRVDANARLRAIQLNGAGCNLCDRVLILKVEAIDDK